MARDDVIDAEQFEQLDEGNALNNTGKTLVFLANNDDKAWKARAIGAHTTLSQDAITGVLSELKKNDLVLHKRPYWIIGRDEQAIEEKLGFDPRGERAQTILDQITVDEHPEDTNDSPEEPGDHHEGSDDQHNDDDHHEHVEAEH